MEAYSIEHHKSSPYQPQVNEAVEAANKNVKNILAKMVVTQRLGWEASVFLMGLLNFYPYIDWGNTLLFSIW